MFVNATKLQGKSRRDLQETIQAIINFQTSFISARVRTALRALKTADHEGEDDTLVVSAFEGLLCR